MKLTTKIAALALAIAATGAQAGSITYWSVLDTADGKLTSYNSANTLVDYTVPTWTVSNAAYDIYLPQFDSAALGHSLLSAQFSVYGQEITAAGVGNKNTSEISGHVTTTGTVNLRDWNGGGILAVALPNPITPTMTIGAGSATVPTWLYYGQDNVPGDPTQVTGASASNSGTSAVFTGAGLTGLDGAGFLTLGTGASAVTGWVGPSNIFTDFTTAAYVYATVTYTWTDQVPEPGSLALLGVAALGFVAARRRAV